MILRFGLLVALVWVQAWVIGASSGDESPYKVSPVGVLWMATLDVVALAWIMIV